jgi:hypothetical protein
MLVRVPDGDGNDRSIEHRSDVADDRVVNRYENHDFFVVGMRPQSHRVVGCGVAV